MSLIISVSGIRGTIGGSAGAALTPVDVIKFAGAYADWLLKHHSAPKVLIGRDGRVSGPIVQQLVMACLQSKGIDVVDGGLSTTPSIEMGVVLRQCQGGIIITASHNPMHWNALKLLNERGEFISEKDGREILLLSEQAPVYAEIPNLGKYSQYKHTIADHIEQILALPLVDVMAIRKKKFRVVADCINSTGAIALPILFEALGVEYKLLNHEINGEFAHDPEPLPQHLDELTRHCASGAHLGIAIDPDVDRLALVDENGHYFGEEYSLVVIADYVLKHEPGPVVSNLSSTRALRDLCNQYNQPYLASAVGEVHVVNCMKAAGAVIGGEGNGGIIYPPLHYGRDALVGIALLLSYLAKSGQSLSALKKNYTRYEMFKDKIALPENVNYDALVAQISHKFSGEKIDTTDGVKVDFADGWIHLRKSNTEPVLRIYSEAQNKEGAKAMCEEIKTLIRQFANGQ